MHLTRARASKVIPIERKGTRYVARAIGSHRKSVPVVIALRDMIKVAKSSKEVQKMITDGKVKINGKVIKEKNASVNLLSVIEADKKFILLLRPNGRFDFEEFKGDSRLCKIVGKKILKKGKIQVNLNDGTNLLIDKKVSLGDSIEIGFDNKIKKIISIERGKEVLVISGKSAGQTGKINKVDGKRASINLDNGKEVVLDISHIIVR